VGLDQPETAASGASTGRSRDPSLAGRAISGTSKKGARIGATLVFVDEAGFYLLPFVVRTYAPRGQTPVLSETVTRDHLSVISGVTPQGQLYLQSYLGTLTGTEVVRFLQHLQRYLPGRLIVIWDGAPIHRNRTVQAFLANQPVAGLQVVALPGYAPDLNPNEGVWDTLKGKELANLACASLPELRHELQAATVRLRRHPEVIRGYFREAGYL
jgi:transposase